MKLLFFCRRFNWPPRMGATVHAGNVMRSLSSLGHEVTLATHEDLHPSAKEWLGDVAVTTVAQTGEASAVDKINSIDSSVVSEPALRRKFRNYWGIELTETSGLAQLIAAKPQDAVIAVGLETLPYLSELEPYPCLRVWYPADDPVLHGVTLMKGEGVTRNRLRELVALTAYQRAYRSAADVAWVVSERDQKWMRRIGGMRRVGLIRNGVDVDHYCSQVPLTKSEQCIFWGNLSFPPNVHALEFFLEHVWGQLVSARPAALFHVCGVAPPSTLRERMMATAGVHFHENLPDLRSMISSVPVAVFPMISGAGVKNKVLEAASMGRVVCASKRCASGLNDTFPAPFVWADSPEEWASVVIAHWDDLPASQRLGQEAREWVSRHHSWKSSAHAAEASIRQLMNVRQFN